MVSSPTRYYARMSLIRANCAPSPPFFLPGKTLYPSPTALLKVRINVGLVFLISSGSGLVEAVKRYLSVILIVVLPCILISMKLFLSNKCTIY
jgi:hypothetical protein